MSKQFEVVQLKPWRNNSGVLTGSENADEEIRRRVHHLAGWRHGSVETLSPPLFHYGIQQSHPDLMPNQPMALNASAHIDAGGQRTRADAETSAGKPLLHAARCQVNALFAKPEKRLK
ncbi:MAG: hypothetical protein NWP69_00520 [Congregibacter sp.]|nr:hypothetical protein [Congregibacter sp.]